MNMSLLQRGSWSFCCWLSANVAHRWITDFTSWLRASSFSIGFVYRQTVNHPVAFDFPDSVKVSNAGTVGGMDSLNTPTKLVLIRVLGSASVANLTRNYFSPKTNFEFLQSIESVEPIELDVGTSVQHHHPIHARTVQQRPSFDWWKAVSHSRARRSSKIISSSNIPITHKHPQWKCWSC